MLTHLSIKKLTLVDHLDLEFHPGMSVITGETGAGKSILLGALGLALGDRADSSLIATGADRTEVNATFDLSGQPEALAWLEEKDLTDGQDCILRRVISRDGRSRAFVNGSSMTLAELRTLSQMLLDIHSQHEHQSLLRKETHRRMLDEFGGLVEVVDELAGFHDQLTDIQVRLKAEIADRDAQSARVQLLSYQAEELDDLAISEGESGLLEQELKRLNAADSNREKLAEVLRCCDREFEDSASSRASRALKIISHIADDRLEGIRQLLDSAVIQIDEAVADLGALVDEFDADPGRQAEVEGRLGRIYEIARKHRVSPDELPALAQRITAELENITNADTRIARLEGDLKEADKRYSTLAEKVSVSRVKTAQLLEGEVTRHLQALGMDGARFKVALGVLDTPGRFGADDIEFRIATLPGSDAGALSRIASGGELSRISLAIQVVTAKTSNTPTLVFDEVDVGVGGATAEIVGSLLRTLGRDAQIICVTHLPQVAAQGHHHYVVSKSTSSKQAATTVRILNEEEKIDEIARMLGGIKKTDQSIAHAAEMIQGARGS
ncbi:MAG: DNA repair protein RecN [Proteobacteria bacterium]|nr:DNA repair protein RecN [Pseudomonadota bacterium]